MKAFTEFEDAFGSALRDFTEGRGGEEIIERDDGMITLSAAAEHYFEEPAGHDREVLDHVHGRVLDVGAGAGRIALYLQQRGHDVVAIDVSPLAVEVMRMRGIADGRRMPLRDVNRKELGTFDSVVMMGNNFGLFGERSRARRLLRRLDRMTSKGAVIVAQSRDPYQTTDDFHFAYQEQNRQRGRMAGQLRIRVRYKIMKTPWLDYLLVSPTEMADIVAGTGWRIREVVGTDSPDFTAIIEKHP